MKKGSLSILLLISSLLVLMSIAPIQSSAQSPVSELLVEYAEDARMTFGEEVDGQVEKRKRISADVELWSLTEGTDAEKLQQELKENPNVLHAELNVERELQAEAVDPTYYTQWWLPHVRPLDMWSRVSEQKMQVSVGVIDSGIDITHQDLHKRIRADGYNFYEDNKDVNDLTGHGTKVSGIIAAEYGNGGGMVGITGPYDVKILPLKVFGTSSKTKVSYIVAAIDYAISRDVDVLNLSFGGPVKSDIENKAIQRAIAAGITVVAANGNKPTAVTQPFYPAEYKNVISVGAVDRWNEYMYSEGYDSSISVVAPGTAIYSTAPGQQYEFSEGTSFSSPIVAGAAAMVKSLHPDKSPQDIEEIIRSTVTYLDRPGIEMDVGPGLLNLQILNEALVPKKIPVERIELNQDAITINMSKDEGLNAMTKTKRITFDEDVKRLYEKEPNNSIFDSNEGSVNSVVEGRIDGMSKDADYYELRMDSLGFFRLEGNWLEDDVSNEWDNEYLRIELFNENGEWLNAADMRSFTDDQMSMYMEGELPKGIYYFSVSSLRENENFFEAREYEIINEFIPNDQEASEVQFYAEDKFLRPGEKLFSGINMNEWPNSVNSSDGIATLNENGMLIGLSPGTTKLNFNREFSKKSLRVHVAMPFVQQGIKILATVYPSGATDQTLIWSSADTSIAEVDQQGIVTAKSVGTTFVTARARTGDVAEVLTVTVVASGNEHKFIGDFQDKDVYSDKVFTVTFTQPLSLFKNYAQDIVISRKSDGNERVKDFTAKVNPLNHKQLLIEPNKLWQEGYHYLTVTKNVQNTHFNPLTKESRLLFYSYDK